MARILGIHGIWNLNYYISSGMSELGAAQAISRAWEIALTAGLDVQADLQVCYYAHHLHQGTVQSDDDPALLEPGAQDILIALADLLNGRSQVAQGTRTVRARAAADWLSLRFPRMTRVSVLAFCREVHTYQTSHARREGIIQALKTAVVEHRPEVLVAHSLGSVIAYETLWAYPDLLLDCMVTLGSPLGMPGVVFERLRPAPIDGYGARPPGIQRWVNIADIGDIVAVPPRLSGRFHGVEKDVQLTLGAWSFHAVRDYLYSSGVRAVLMDFLELSG